MVTIIILSLAGGLLGLWVFLSQQRAGQFDDLEEVKYQLFREEKE